MMDGALQRKMAYQLIDELPLDRLGVVIQMLEMITGKHDVQRRDKAYVELKMLVSNSSDSDENHFFGCLKNLVDDLALQKVAREA